MIIKKYQIFYFLQATLKYCPFWFGIVLRRTFYRPFFKEIGKSVSIQDNVLFKFPGEISIGEGTHIESGCLLVGKSGLTIGKNVLIGAGSKIITSDHITDRLDIPIKDQGLTFKQVVLEDDIWFGFNCVVLQGCLIGRSSIIGANAVVTKSIPAYSVAVGVPAKVVKKRTELTSGSN